MSWNPEHVATATCVVAWVYFFWSFRKLERRVRGLAEDVHNRAVLLPQGPVGPAGPPGIMGPPGPAASCRCADAEAAARDARTPQEKRTATLRLHKLIREGKMEAPEGWEPPRKRKKKSRGKKKKAG